MSLRLLYPGDQKDRLGLEISGSGHTVADLLDIWQPLCDDDTIYKQFARNQHAPCISCISNCCQNAYVTPDLVALKAMIRRLDIRMGDMIREHMDGDKLARGIPRLKTPCPFLDPLGSCRLYPARSLLCRFYLCTPLSGELEQLIYSLTLVGSIAAWEYLKSLGDMPPLVATGLSSFDRLTRREMETWEDHPGVRFFLQAESYHDIPLDIFLPADKEQFFSPGQDFHKL